MKAFLRSLDLRFVLLAAVSVGSAMSSSAALALFPDFTELVEESSAAVVNIRTTRAQRQRSPQFDEREIPDFLRRFFRDRQDQPPGPGVGSGFIIESDGYILTNNHVVEGADEIIVSLSDRREREARVIGQDPLSDLALLKIEEEDLPVVEVGKSENLKPGQWVVAIGSPFGFEHSVTAGIVSATGRSLPENNGNYVPFIQTDVAINPGNSGGPLLDLQGRVVGINSQIFTRSGGFMGLSFSIPIDVAMEVVAQLKEDGEVSRGWLGVLIQPVDRDLAESFGLDRPSGALVSQVFADSPAETGGLREGDIIISFNGRMIDLSSDLPHMVGRTPADTEAEVEIVRNKKKQKLQVVIGRLDDSEAGPVRQGSPAVPRDNRLGLQLRDLETAERRRLGVDGGVLVIQVSSGPASESGIQRGDVITHFDGEAISDADQLERMIENLPAGITLHTRIVRNQRPQYLALRIPAE
jgi:serine protease Do